MTEETGAGGPTVPAGHLPVTELVAEVQGGLSPFGEDVTFPLPPEQVSYVHPGPENRPARAGE